MKKTFCFAIFAAATLIGPAIAAPTSYSGSLSGPGGLEVGGDGFAWTMSPLPTLTWTVTETTPGTWHYRYTLNVTANSISRLTFEAADGSHGPAFLTGDLQSVAIGWPGVGTVSVGNHLVIPENPGMPQDMWGIQVDMASYVTTVTLEFDTSRRPVWGDFYARTVGYICPADGTYTTPLLNWVHNRGFTAGDMDPTDPVGDGSVLNHILVPGSLPIIPAPSAVLLAMLGLGLIGRFRQRELR